MRPIPKKMKDEMHEDPFYDRCCRRDLQCQGRTTWEHCWTYGKSQINEKWAIIPLCWHHHLGEGFEKNLGRYFSLLIATPEDLKKYPKKNWEQEFNNLHNQYKDDYRTNSFKRWCKITGKSYSEEV